MISHYQPPHGQREWKEAEATSSSQSFKNALKDPTVKLKMQEMSRAAQSKRGRPPHSFSPSVSEVSDGSEHQEIVVIHKRAPPEPATPADLIDIQSKHIDGEVARAQVQLQAREKLHALRGDEASREKVLATLFFGKHIYRLRTPLTANDPELVHRPRAGPTPRELATLEEIDRHGDRLLTLDRSVVHYDQFRPPPSSFNTPDPKRLRSDCSYGRDECEPTITTCEKCHKFVCDLCARNLSIARFGDKEEDFHFCDEHAGDAPGIAVNVFNGRGLQVATQQNLCMSENESADPNIIKCDVCGLGADPKLVQPCEVTGGYRVHPSSRQARRGEFSPF
jgi:hypothetical protein